MSDTSITDDGETHIITSLSTEFVIKDIKKVVRDHPNKRFVEFLIPAFSANHHESDHSFWRLAVYPSGSSNNNEGYLSVYLLSEETQNVRIVAKYSIVNSEGDLVYSALTKEYDQAAQQKWGYGDFISHTSLFAVDSNLLQDGNLTLSVELKIKSKQGPAKYPNHFMEVLYESLFEDPDRYDADFTIECKDQLEVKCHRNILAAALSYFEKMSSAPMIEKESKRVKWDDIDITTCKTILKYIYTGQLANSDASLELYQLAARLFLEDLKARCSSYLTKTLNVNNCVERIVWADRLNDRGLKRRAADIIDQNNDKLEKDVRKALKGNDSLALDLYFNKY